MKTLTVSHHFEMESREWKNELGYCSLLTAKTESNGERVIFNKNKVSCYKLDSNNKEHFDAVTLDLKFWAKL